MNTEIIKIYCICNEFIKALKIPQDSFSKMTDCEVLTTALVSMKYFSGNLELGRRFLAEYSYIHNMLSKSRLNRRLHAFPPVFWHVLLKFFAFVNKANQDKETIVDSFPVKACHNVRKCRLYKDKKYLGFNASKDEYFTGIKAHVITNSKGQPLDFSITEGSMHDLKALKSFDLDFLFGKILYGDKAYNHYEYEDLLMKLGTYLMPQRKENSTRPWSYKIYSKINAVRKRIETSFSQINTMLPRRIQAVTAKGFELKVILGIVALALGYLV